MLKYPLGVCEVQAKWKANSSYNMWPRIKSLYENIKLSLCFLLYYINVGNEKSLNLVNSKLFHLF